MALASMWQTGQPVTNVQDLGYAGAYNANVGAPASPIGGNTPSTPTQSTASGYPSYTSSYPVLAQAPGQSSGPQVSTYQPAGSWGATPTATMENAFGQYGANYLGGNNSQDYYNAVTPSLGGPTALSTLYNSMSGMGPTASAQALAGTAASLGGPGNAQQAFQQVGQSWLDPSASSAVLSGAAGQLGGPSESQNYYWSQGGQYAAPTAIGQLAASNPYAQQLGGEALGRNAQAMYGNSTASQDIFGSTLAQAQMPSELSQQAGNISGLVNGANYMQQFAGNNAGQLSGPGALEQFAASDLNRTNPYYDMLQKQQADTIDQRAAARGAYGAGGSLAAQALGSADLRAQQYQQEGQLQGSAQQAQLARLGLGANVAQGASGERVNQGNALQALAQGMFGDRMQGAQLGLSAAGQSDTANMARLAGITGMTQAGDQATLARLAGQAGLASDASNSALNYLNSGMTAAGQADQSQLARVGMLGNLAGQSDTQRLAGLAGYGNMAMAGDQSQLARAGLIGSLAGQTDTANQNFLNSQLNAAGQVDANQIARIGLGAQMAGQADTQSLNWLNNYFNQANNAQSAGQTRIDNEMNQLFNSAALQAGLFSNFYGSGGQQSVEAGVGSVNAGVNATATGQAAQQQGNKNVLGLIGSFFG